MIFNVPQSKAFSDHTGLFWGPIRYLFLSIFEIFFVRRNIQVNLFHKCLLFAVLISVKNTIWMKLEKRHTYVCGPILNWLNHYDY